jgi:hypothetical protein
MSMVSNILIVADATRQSAVSILEAFQIVQKDQPSVKVIFASYLSDFFKKSLGPNTLNHWMKEEKECLETVRNYFVRMDISYDFKVITVPPWKMVFDEMKAGVHDLMILQSEFLKMWRKNGMDHGLCPNVFYKPDCPVLVVNPSNEVSLFKHLFDSETI